MKSKNLKLYNSLTRRIEPFEPGNPERVTMYVCGPTVYGDSHIGHAKSYVSFDTIFRWLVASGYNPLYVQNLTDVGHLLGDDNDGEDRILKKSRETRTEPMAIAEHYTHSYFEDMDRLNIRRPHISPRATGHIPEQIELIETLIEKGYAYESNGSVYFDVKKFGEYGKLSGKRIDDLLEGTRFEVHSDKKSPLDFALWKKAEPNHLMRWRSPWSIGFPGWHIECSAMSMKYLGTTFDIHGGGLDNQFPHHECEIAQSEAATGKPFARYWIHNNMVTVNGEKMSRSKGNVMNLKDLLRSYDPMVLRFFVLNSHYRSPIDFSAEAILAAGRGFERLMQTAGPYLKITGTEEPVSPVVKGWVDEFDKVMNEDFNTPQALAVVFNAIRSINSDAGLAGNQSDLACFFRYTLSEVLGLVPAESGGKNLEKELGTAMDLILELRSDYRKEKNWAKSDLIRDRLASGGLMIEDGKDGARWKIKN
ncbi:MAG: cysteine--tRNA ligase [Bacteroidetes bacterium]|nr:cysteine--tRNA ligase [Bacteroidota bacterium]